MDILGEVIVWLMRLVAVLLALVTVVRIVLPTYVYMKKKGIPVTWRTFRTSFEHVENIS